MHLFFGNSVESFVVDTGLREYAKEVLLPFVTAAGCSLDPLLVSAGLARVPSD